VRGAEQHESPIAKAAPRTRARGAADSGGCRCQHAARPSERAREPREATTTQDLRRTRRARYPRSPLGASCVSGAQLGDAAFGAWFGRRGSGGRQPWHGRAGPVPSEFPVCGTQKAQPLPGRWFTLSLTDRNHRGAPTRANALIAHASPAKRECDWGDCPGVASERVVDDEAVDAAASRTSRSAGSGTRRRPGGPRRGRRGRRRRSRALPGAARPAQTERLDVWRDHLDAEVGGGGYRLAQREADPGEQAQGQLGRRARARSAARRVEARDEQRARPIWGSTSAATSAAVVRSRGALRVFERGLEVHVHADAGRQSSSRSPTRMRPSSSVSVARELRDVAAVGRDRLVAATSTPSASRARRPQPMTGRPPPPRGTSRVCSRARRGRRPARCAMPAQHRTSTKTLRAHSHG